MAQEPGVVEAGVQAGQRQAPRDGRVRRQQGVQLDAVVGRPQGVALDDRVGVLACQPAVLDEGHQDPAAGVEPEPALDVLAHPVGADDQALHERGHLGQHVVEEDGGVGQQHALSRRVADVPIVPERLVLERRAGVATEQAGEPCDPLGDDRVALVGHRGAALLAHSERLHELADLGVLEVADLGREASPASALMAIAASTRHDQSRWTNGAAG